MFVTSDQHFGHFNAIKHENRPFATTEEMNEFMIKQWNSVVGPKDIIYHLGDFAFRCGLETMTEIFHRLNGRKMLIRGNHDEKPRKYFEMGWEQVYDSKSTEWDNVEFTMCHYPLAHSRAKQSLHDYGQFHIHGHTHSKTPAENGRQYNVSVEHHNYTPVHINQIIKYWRSLDAEIISN